MSFRFGIGNLVGGAAGTVDPCGRKTPVSVPRLRQEQLSVCCHKPSVCHLSSSECSSGITRICGPGGTLVRSWI